jgi:hypothetical protein
MNCNHWIEAHLFMVDFAGKKQQSTTHAKTQLLAEVGKVAISNYF